jgi:hypothetical protein
MILWLGLGATSKIAAIFSGCLLPIIVSAYNGARGVDQTLIWSALGLGATRRQVLWEVVLPGAVPDVMAGIRTALAIAFVLMVTSEFLVGGRGLGFLISFTGDAGAYDTDVRGHVTCQGFCRERLRSIEPERRTFGHRPQQSKKGTVRQDREVRRRSLNPCGGLGGGWLLWRKAGAAGPATKRRPDAIVKSNRDATLFRAELTKGRPKDDRQCVAVATCESRATSRSARP